MEVTSPREDPAPPVLPAAALTPSVSLAEASQDSGCAPCYGTECRPPHKRQASINAPFLKWVGVEAVSGEEKKKIKSALPSQIQISHPTC